MDDRRRPVAQRDHLALAARLEPRRHEERVGARVDPPGHHPIEALDERDPVRVRGDEPAERVGELRMATPLHDDPSTAFEDRRRGAGDEVEPLLRVQAPDHPEDRAPVGWVEPDPLEQIGAAGGLAGQIGP